MAEFDSVIPAGGSGKLTAKIKTTATQRGPVSKSVSVTTDSVGAERLMLNVKFTAVSAILVLPRAQVILSGIEGDDVSNTLLVRRSDGKELEITDVENRDDRIVVTTEKVDKAKQVGRQEARAGDVVLAVSVAPEMTAVSTNGRFRFGTNHPDADHIDVTYSIRLRPLIEARPAQLRLLVQEGNAQARTMLMRVQHNRQKQFRITGFESSKPELFEAFVTNGDVRQQVHTVVVRLNEEVQPGDVPNRLLESLVLTTDDPAEPKVEVSVLIEPRALRRPAQARPLE